MKDKLEMIMNRREGLTKDSTTLMSEYVDRQNRLKKLVDKHGIESVALASGLSVNTVKQYCRTRLPNTIGENPVRDAETILKGI